MKQNEGVWATSDSGLELASDDGVRLVSFVFGISLYTDVPLSVRGDQVLQLYERFFEVCPRSALTFYATENMSRHKPITKSTFNMLPSWLKEGSAPREYICLQLKDGVQYQDAPRCKFEVYGVEPKSKLFGRGRANILSISFPISDIASALRVRDFFVQACELFPFQSSYAGFSFECSRYEKEISETHAWSLSMRYKAIDIFRIPADSLAVGNDALKGVGWLTGLGDSLIHRLGGLSSIRKRLSKEIEIIELPSGIVVQAGGLPVLGDNNRPESLELYRQIYAVVGSLIQTSGRRSPSLNLANDYVERTEQWFTRLSNG